MSDALLYALSFVVALGILITVHEFGHFWVARRLGVKVLRFSVGFGKPLWSHRSRNGETEYVLAALPLGGYVKMLDEREAPVSESERPRAFNNKPVATRIAVVSAGPLFNLLFAVIAFWLIFLGGVPGVVPMVGQVTPGSPAAAAGLQPEARIVAVNGESTPTWEAARLALFESTLGKDSVSLTTRDPHGETATHRIQLDRSKGPIEPQNLFERLGFEPWQPEAIVAGVQPGSPADQAHLQPGDRIVALNGDSVRYWSEWVQFVRAHPGQSIAVTVERDGETIQLELRPAEREDNGERIGFAGVERQPLPKDMFAEQQYGPLEGLAAGVEKTWDMSVLMLRVLGGMLTGEASLNNISGPLTIAQFAGDSASLGIVPFLNFLAVVSVSLGVLNLLPIPILDGGHLMYYLIELAKGSPVSEQAQQVAQRFGIVLLLMLMALAFYNDFMRLFS